jgi:hypothetical protein
MMNGEGAESRASALFGVDSGDGRGNIMLGLELAERDAIHADDTDFWHDALRDGTTYPTQLIYTGPLPHQLRARPRRHEDAARRQNPRRRREMDRVAVRSRSRGAVACAGAQ